MSAARQPEGAPVGAGLFSLAGRTALVTGGGRGIGLAIAQALAAHGARVILAGRQQATLDDALGQLSTSAQAAHMSLRLDVTSEEEVERADQRLQRDGIALDVLVNNAGIDPHYAPLEKTSMQEWESIVATNLTGVLRCCRHLGARMVQRQRGSILNISSIAGQVALKRQAPYCASKGGVEQLTRALAVDWAEHGVRVNTIGYGFVETDLTRSLLHHPHLGGMVRTRTPLGRPGLLGEVGGAAVFLASDAASYVTGHSLMVDGGWTAA